MIELEIEWNVNGMLIDGHRIYQNNVSQIEWCLDIEQSERLSITQQKKMEQNVLHRATT